MVKRILGGILFICIGIFLMIASIKMIFVDNPKAKKLLSEAVYVTTDTVDPANDGKAVIVSAPFKLVESAYDDERTALWDRNSASAPSRSPGSHRRATRRADRPVAGCRTCPLCRSHRLR